MRKKLATLIGIALTVPLLPVKVSAHGAVSHPISRQYQCYKEGGFWGSAEQVPNPGCRESVRKSGSYPFQQWNEVAANPNPRHDQKAIEKAVPNGLLCAGGDPKKAGLDVPQSAGWKITEMKPGNMDLTWAATAPHNPAALVVYITKKGANYANRALEWSDLDLANPLFKGAMPQPNRNVYPPEYKIPMKIPSDRNGNAIIYSIWQREDAGNEGFFNCSDVKILGEAGNEEPAKPGDEWIEEKAFITTADKPVVGDKVRFRVLGASGARGLEAVDVTIPVTNANISNYHWVQELAEKVNTVDPNIVQIGIKEHGHITFNPASDRIYQNLVWLKDKKYSSSLSVIDKEVTPPPVIPDDKPVVPDDKPDVPDEKPDVPDNKPDVPDNGGSGSWDQSKVYTGGEVVTWNGIEYKAQWWTKGDKPGESHAWKKISQGADVIAEWNKNQVYNGGDQAKWKGKTYRAAWWTSNEEPGKSSVWKPE